MLTYSLFLAIAITVLIFNIILVVRIKYGDATITHLTTQPYKISMILLILMIFIVSTYKTIDVSDFPCDTYNCFPQHDEELNLGYKILLNLFELAGMS